MASSCYQKAFLEVSAALQQNQEAFKTLHSIYKLPSSYASLPASATIQAMETLGVFSEDNPVGIIDLPLVLGMKKTHRKVKDKMRKKVKYHGFNGITMFGKVKPQLEKIVDTIHETFQLLISQIELLDMEMAKQTNEGSNQLDNIILAVKDTKKMMDNSIEAIPKTDDRRQHVIQVSHTAPVRFTPKRVKSLSEAQLLDTPDTRKDYDPVPIPPDHRSAMQPLMTTPRIDVSASLKEEFVRQHESSSLSHQQQDHQFNDEAKKAATDDEYEDFIPTKSPTKAPLVLNHPKQEFRKASPGPPIIKPKPQRHKVPILPPHIATELSKTDSVVSSDSYVHMSPAPEKLNTDNPSTATHDYVNVGSKGGGTLAPSLPVLQRLQGDESFEVATDSENEMAYEEYETF